jgi:Helitron helicase-like domain at N-terminus
MIGMLIREGMAHYWITGNPSDLRNPHLAGIPIPAEAMPRASTAIRKIPVTANPVAVAEFFHHICDAFFANLLRSNTDELGILGKVSSHYGVVEANGRGMLHMHCLVWLKGNFTFEELRTQVLHDTAFAQRLISFLESIITNTVEKAIENTTVLFQDIPLPSPDQSPEDFCDQLVRDSHTIANKTQRHSQTHNVTCFKYGNNKKNVALTCRVV